MLFIFAPVSIIYANMFNGIWFSLPFLNVLSSDFTVQAQYPGYWMGHLSAEPEWFPTEMTSCREDQMNMRFRNEGPGIKNICQLL